MKFKVKSLRIPAGCGGCQGTALFSSPRNSWLHSGGRNVRRKGTRARNGLSCISLHPRMRTMSCGGNRLRSSRSLSVHSWRLTIGRVVCSNTLVGTTHPAHSSIQLQEPAPRSAYYWCQNAELWVTKTLAYEYYNYQCGVLCIELHSLSTWFNSESCGHHRRLDGLLWTCLGTLQQGPASLPSHLIVVEHFDDRHGRKKQIFDQIDMNWLWCLWVATHSDISDIKWHCHRVTAESLGLFNSIHSSFIQTEKSDTESATVIPRSKLHRCIALTATGPNPQFRWKNGNSLSLCLALSYIGMSSSRRSQAIRLSHPLILFESVNPSDEFWVYHSILCAYTRVLHNDNRSSTSQRVCFAQSGEPIGQTDKPHCLHLLTAALVL